MAKPSKPKKLRVRAPSDGDRAVVAALSNARVHRVRHPPRGIPLLVGVDVRNAVEPCWLRLWRGSLYRCSSRPN
eukprot:722305-Pyramimonas_sp.AAC.1